MNVIENVSDTALWVAYYRALESEKSNALFHDPYAKKLAGKRGEYIAKNMPHGKTLAWIMAIRTQSIDSMILECVDKGVDAVVNIGAGLDSRPYRLKLPANLRWIEIDFPHVIEYKSKLLKDDPPICKLERISLDLSQRNRAIALYQKIGNENKNVLLITEGVIIYLSPQSAKELAQDLGNVSSFHYWIQDYRDTRKGSWKPSRIYKKKLESSPFLFEVESSLAFFQAEGWNLEKEICSYDEGKRLGRPFPVPFPWSFLLKFILKYASQSWKKTSGYLLLKNNRYQEK